MRSLLIGLAAFLTLVDLFATQAILPALAEAYGVRPAAMGLAVNASTLGMAIAALGVAFFSRHIDRRLGIVLSLGLLALPTALLASAPDLATFAALRIAQGLCMATAFALTLSYLAEHCSASESAGAFAAYIAGNVVSNLVGRLIAGTLVDHLGIAANFLAFSALNLAGAALVWFWLGRAAPAPMPLATHSTLALWAMHFRNPALCASFAVGFLILFAFIGTFSYVNFVLVRDPLALSRTALGLVYLVFLPSVFSTPLAGQAVTRFGTRASFWGALAVAGAGLPLLVLPSVPAVLVGLTLVGAGTFFAQATTTAFVGRAATTDRGSASGIYLASYFSGGLAGTALLGAVFERFGWAACVAGIGFALALAALLALRMTVPAQMAPAAA
ncbi:MAG: MFS transporter [Proteobacteria bacterium]|nr:MFS transporter [Burkholderiales bacterium]